MNFSDYIVYVDESGDHGVNSINPEYPIFCLAFCIFKKSEYIEQIVPEMQRLKFKYWGHDAVVLHEHDIRKPNTVEGFQEQEHYKILFNKKIKNALLADISNFIENAPFEIITTVIDKKKHKDTGRNPYEKALAICLATLQSYLYKNKDSGKISVIFESRGKVEDFELKEEFKNICNSICNIKDFSMIKFEMIFVKKSANCTGLQIADLVARPIGLKNLKPEQENRAYKTIEKNKIYTIISDDYIKTKDP